MMAEKTQPVDKLILIPYEKSELTTTTSGLQHKSKEAVCVTYKRRWYLVVLFGLVGGSQGLIWNTWGPLYLSANIVYGWTEADIALMTNYGPIDFVLSAFIFSWILDVKGLRMASLITSGFVTMGAGLRCVTSSPPMATWLVHLGQFLNGFGGIVAMGGSALMSSVWFPVEQRSTATALISITNSFGASLSFILPQYIVPSLTAVTASPNVPHKDTEKASSPKDIENLENLTAEMMTLMWYEFYFCGALFCLLLLYFPNKPPSPPSITASLDRIDYREGLTQLLKNKMFWILGLAYSVPCGVLACWQTVFAINVGTIGVSQNEAGMLGFWGAIVQLIMTIIISILADRFKRTMKAFVITSYTVATLMFVIFMCIYVGVIPYSTWLFYVSYIISNSATFAPTALFYEMACDSTYPVPEGLTSTTLTLLMNIPGLIFLFILMIPGFPTSLMNWIVLVCMLFSIPVMLLFEENYTRLEIDTSGDKHK